MMDFFVHGSPKPQPRPRAFARRMGNGAFAARVYDAGTAEGWKSAIAAEIKDHWDGVQLQGPLRVSLAFRFERPKGHHGAHGLKPSAPTWHQQRPDCDNLAKAVLDCLTTLGVWEDDCQIVELVTSKRWCAGEKEGCQIRVDRHATTARESEDAQLRLGVNPA